MTLSIDFTPGLALVSVVLFVLGAGTGVVQYLKSRRRDLNPAVLRTLSLRIRAYWLLTSITAAGFLLPHWMTITLFGLISFWSLREFITLTPTRTADHRALFWVFFVVTPLQYVLVALDYYNLHSILVPVYAFLFIAARVAVAGDYKRFLERTAKIQAGLMICVYCLSHAPALLNLHPHRPQANAELLFFFVFMVQLGDLLEYGWDKLLGRTVIAPAISRNKTWEGFLGGVASTTLAGTALWWALPETFEDPWQAGVMSLVIAVAGFGGGLTMSAIKRDRGVRDYGTLIEGHGGILDRLDSLCFAAPVFYHVARFTVLGEWGG